jgi:hypothetical protein
LTTGEISTLQQTLQSAQQYYSANAEEATKLITIGATKPDAAVPAAELAAWTVITSQLFNLDEALTK